ncbi:MAG: GAF domain-containing protein [Chloroflexi bacterium]|nr:GAF domain-containing protein [Chloroflexota bacterium]
MAGLIRTIFRTDVYDDLVQQNRAGITYSITVALIIYFAAYSALLPSAPDGSTILSAINESPQGLLGLLGIGVVYLLGFLSVATVRNRRLNLAATLTMLMWMVSVNLISARLGLDGTVIAQIMVMFPLLGGVLLRERGVVIGIAAGLFTIVMTLLVYTILPTVPGAAVPIAPGRLFSLVAGLLGYGTIAYLFLRMSQVSTIQSASRASQDRATLAEVTTRLARRMADRAALEDVMDTAINEINASYEQIYHSQVFLVHELTREARLAASTGTVGQMLLRRRHSLNVGGQSVIGRVTASGEIIVANAGSSDTVHKRNEFLPETQVEAAFPLKIGGRVIGALDLQSRDPDAFPPEDLPVFQALADVIAVAIDNAQRLAQTDQRLEDNQKLIEQLRRALGSAEQQNRQLTARAWAHYLSTKGGALGLGINFAHGTSTSKVPRTPTLEQAMSDNHVVQSEHQQVTTIAVPLRVRGQVIGALEFDLRDRKPLAPDELDLVQEVSERFGAAVENTRLYEESRRVAERETILNDLSSRLQVTNVDSVLRAAAQGLQDTIGAQRVAIRLGAPGLEAVTSAGPPAPSTAANGEEHSHE